jgi:predicted site-specific integrase-resolvase
MLNNNENNNKKTFLSTNSSIQEVHKTYDKGINNAIIGYAGVSTEDQHLNMQIKVIQKYATELVELVEI